MPSALIQRAFEAVFSLACSAIKESRGAAASLGAMAEIRLLLPSSLTWLSPKKYFDLNILLLISQALSDPHLSLRQFQISVLTWTCLQEHLIDRCTLFFCCSKLQCSKLWKKKNLCFSESPSIFTLSKKWNLDVARLKLAFLNDFSEHMKRWLKGTGWRETWTSRMGSLILLPFNPISWCSTS